MVRTTCCDEQAPRFAIATICRKATPAQPFLANKMDKIYDTSIEDHTEPLLPARDHNDVAGGKKSKMVQKLSLVLGSLVGILVHLATLGINVWLCKAGFSLDTRRIATGLVSSCLISTLVVMVYTVLATLADALQPVQLITLNLETRFVAGFLCTLVLMSTCYDSIILMYLDGPTIYTFNAVSLVVLLLGWLSIRMYEKARLQEIAEETDEIACS